MKQKTLYQVLEDAGLAAHWEAQGEVRGEARGEEIKAKTIARNMIQEGLTREQVARMTGLDFSTLESLI